MDRRAVRRWFGKRPDWVVWRILTTLEEHWDQWFGDLTLKGLDPRRWDLGQLLAAFEATVRQGCKDEAEWSRKRASLYAPPRGQARQPATAASGAQTVSSMEAMLARMEAADAAFGAL